MSHDEPDPMPEEMQAELDAIMDEYQADALAAEAEAS